MNQVRAEDHRIQGEGTVSWAPGTKTFVVICDPTVDADEVREMVADKLADTRGVIVEEVAHG